MGRRSDEEWQEDVRFWLPDSPDELSYGRVEFDPSRGPLAHTVDSALVSPLGAMTADVPALHGEEIHGRPFTLLEGIITHSKTSLGRSRPGNTVDALFAVFARGAHVRNQDEIFAGSVACEISGLLTLLTGGDGAPMLDVKPERGSHASIDVELPIGGLTLEAGAGTRFSGFERTHAVDAGAMFTFDAEIPLREVDERVGPLLDLITFSTRRPSRLREMRLYPRRTTPEDVVDFEQLEREVSISRAQGCSSPARRSRIPTLWLNPATVDDPGALFVSWYELRRRLGPVWTLLFGTLNRPDLPLENQLLNLTAFAEGAHRTLHDEPPLTANRHREATAAMLSALNEKAERAVYRAALTFANSQSQRTRLRWLASRATHAVDDWDLDIGRFCSEIGDTRNWLTHWGKRGKHVQEGAGLVTLLRQLNVVISINLLLDLGLGTDGVASARRAARRITSL